jgi:hypothetical protein
MLVADSAVLLTHKTTKPTTDWFRPSHTLQVLYYYTKRPNSAPKPADLCRPALVWCETHKVPLDSPFWLDDTFVEYHEPFVSTAVVVEITSILAAALARSSC